MRSSLYNHFFTKMLVLLFVGALAACDGNATKVTSAGSTAGTVVGTITQTDTDTSTDTSTGTSSSPIPLVETAGDSVCVDTPPVGDGWGWNGSASCRIGGDTVTVPGGQDQNNVPGAQEITDLILITGQSNALGAGTAFDPNLDAPDDRVFAFTDSGWQVADLRQIWDLGFPLGRLDTPSNNFGLHFGKRLTERRTDRTVGIILITAPGESISHWVSNGAFFEQIRDKVSRAVSDLPFKSQVDAILWHQGESDGADRDEYGIALNQLIADFRSEPWFNVGFPFICGETANLPVNNQLIRLNSDGDPFTACVESDGLDTDDGTHFTAPSLRTLGRRYANEYLDLFLGGQ